MNETVDTHPSSSGSARRARLLPWWWPLVLGCVICVGLAFPFLLRKWVTWSYTPFVFSVEAAPPQRVAIVFGARVYRDGRLSAMLRDRVDTAIDLYRAGKVQKLLLSGDNSLADYNEPGAMATYAIEHGVAAEDIQPDYGGRTTYDSCYRARAIFQLETAILVTQEFHLPRALLLCRALGIDATGVFADRRTYDPRSVAWSETREIPALIAAVTDVIRRAPPPILGEPIPIP